MKKPITAILHSFMRMVRRYIISNWLLIVVFSCLGAYLIFPGPLDALSSALWPVGIGKHARISYTVSGSTTYPGTVSLNITVTNNDVTAHDYAILALIGARASAWWGPGFYKDNLSACTDVRNITDPWYNEAFICTGPLNPGQSFQVTRKIEIANDTRIKDTLVEVFDKNDASKDLVRLIKPNVIHVGG